MNRKPITRRGCAVALMGALLVASVLPTVAQGPKPQETKGVSIDETTVLGIAPQIPQFKGFGLRLRKVTVEPGGVIAHHSHAERPIVVYIMSGELTEYRDDGQVITHRAGEQWTEGADVAHWSENRGQVPAVLIGADIVPEE